MSTWHFFNSVWMVFKVPKIIRFIIWIQCFRFWGKCLPQKIPVLFSVHHLLRRGGKPWNKENFLQFVMSPTSSLEFHEKKTTADHAVRRPWAPRPLWMAWDVRRGQGWRGTKVSSWSMVYLVVGRVDGMKPEGNGGLTEFTKINGSISIVSRSSIHISYPWSRTLSNLSCSGKIGCECGQISMAPKKQKISWHPFWGVNLSERNRGLSECTNKVRPVALIWLYKEAFFECGRKEMT